MSHDVPLWRRSLPLGTMAGSRLGAAVELLLINIGTRSHIDTHTGKERKRERADCSMLTGQRIRQSHEYRNRLLV